MSCPALALTWHAWYPARWTAGAVLLYLGVLGVLARVPAAQDARATLLMFTSFFAFGALFLLGAFAYPGADVLAAGSGFPSAMLTLPVRSWQLVLWPMLAGMLCAALCWLLPVCLVLAPLGVQPPLWWPAALAAASVACLQALLWTPFAVPYARVLTALVGLPALLSGAAIAFLSGVPQGALLAACIPIALLAYAAAVAGVERTRHGDAAEWRLPAVSPVRQAATARAFASPAQAQFWYEWRRGGWVLPALMGVICLLLTLPFLWVGDRVPLEPNPPRSPFGSLEINLWLQLQAGVLFWPPLLGAILGCGRGLHFARRDALALQPFQAVRPLTETQFAGSRFAVAALSTALTWAVLLLFLGTWLLLPARDGSRTGPLLSLLPVHCPPATMLTGAAVLAVLVFWTWKNQVQGLFAEVSGRPWLVNGAPLVLHAAVLLAFILVVHWAGQPRETDLRDAALPAWLAPALGAAITLKLTGAASALAALRRRGAPTLHLAGAILLWGTAATALYTLLAWVAAHGAPSSDMARFLADRYLPLTSGIVPDALRTPAYLGACAVLFTPLTRLLLAPLTLASNRHR